MTLGKYFAENYDVLVMEDIQVKKLVGKCFRKMRLYDVVFNELKSVVKSLLENHG
ncbi:hypothetical protein HS7_17170 [Sulfolobales archaeon HS-7]|nr:hypothetical protein HS7_17170 [Sulfolobales archaeon HS-7]